MPQSSLSFIKDGVGLPLVFQHGLGANKDQTKQLLGGVQGIQLISFDAPGHGDSPLADSSAPSFDYYTDQAIALLDQLQIQDAVFGGISMGSGIALNAALRYPDRVKGLLLVRPAWLDLPCPKNLEILIEASRHIDSESLSEFRSIPEFLEIENVLPAAADSILGVFNPSQQSIISHVLRSMVNSKPFPSLSDLDQIDIPAIIIGSDDDPLHPYSMAEVLHQNIGESTLHKVISRYIDDPKHRNEVSNHIKRFLRKYEESLGR